MGAGGGGIFDKESLAQHSTNTFGPFFAILSLQLPARVAGFKPLNLGALGKCLPLAGQTHRS